MTLKMMCALMCAGLLGLAQPATAATATGPDASAECVSCHDDEDLPDLSRGPHARPGRKAPAAGVAGGTGVSARADHSSARLPTCIGCHGTSPTHVKQPEGAKERPRPDIVYSKKSTQTSEERSAACVDCHQKDAKRMLWAGSQHQGADLACNACHKVHTNSDKVMAKATQTDVCYACHKAQRAQLNRPSHHPVPEGRMSCSDCHNAHGSIGPKLARRDSTNATCYGCHTEKRGSFVHPHEPVTEDCAACHNPHGSTVAAMLKSRPPMLCQQCHTPHVAGGVGALGGQPGVLPPAVPGQSRPEVTANSSGKNVVNMWQGRSCLNCHTQIHGSNNPSATNPTPQYLLR